jgi:putative colanic acid biosynthesis UDP-glucose lipid carrier transferase
MGSDSLVDKIAELHRSQGLNNINYFPYPENSLSDNYDIKTIKDNEFDALLGSSELDGVWITLSLSNINYLDKLKVIFQNASVPVRYVPDVSALRIINNSVANIEGIPVISLTDSPMYGFNLVLKWLEDKMLSLAILIISSPLLILTAIAVKLSSPGPVIYRQERVGWSGEVFNMYKFRSMPVDSEKGGVEWGARSKQPTKIGAFLRKTSIDEFPQFINVLKGDMSIVGPRPERAVFIDKFKKEIPGYMQKHLVKAGITGWAQINGWRGDTDLHKRIEYDLFYIENWSLWFDLKIIVMTIYKGFINRNAY